MKLVARTRPVIGVTRMLRIGVQDGRIHQRRRARHLHVVTARGLERRLQSERREQRRRPDAGADDGRIHLEWLGVGDDPDAAVDWLQRTHFGAGTKRRVPAAVGECAHDFRAGRRT